MNRLMPLAFAAAAALAGLPAAAQTVLTASTWVPPSHPLSLAQEEWCDLLEKNTTGKMKCNILPRAVANPPGTYDAVRNGLADLSFTVHGYTPGRFVTTQMAEFSALGDSAEAMSVAFDRVARKNPAVLQEHQGVQVITLFTHGPGIVMTTKGAVTKMEDLQGQKWRVGGGMVNDMTKALGMNATLKPATENYELLSSGVMDGTLLPAESMESFKIDKLIKNVTVFPGGLYNTSFVMMMNQGRYEKLSADEKKAVDAISGEVAARIIGRQWDNFDRRAYALMQANNIQVTKADARFVNDVKAKIAPLEANWAKAAEGKGLKDPAKVLADFRAEIAKVSK